jgi:GT2 family glycosyltransferase
MAHKSVRLVEHQERPFNFSRVNNLGVRAADGKFLCFLNDDVEVITTDWLERLVARVQLDGVGAAGPMLYYPWHDIQHAGIVLMGDDVADHVLRHHRRGHFDHLGRGGLEQDYSCVTAACMLADRQTFESVGGFDEALPVAFNDVDLCIRIRRGRKRIVWTPSVEMYHHESLTFGHHASAARRDQFRHDVKVMQERWKEVLFGDPCYNPNLSLKRGMMFSLAWPPRVPEAEKVLSGRGTASISRTSELPSG